MSAEKVSSSLLSVAGYLQLPDKPGGKFKKRWFWFDERTCSLKYYKDQATYRNRIYDILGELKLTSAKIIPPLIDGTDCSNSRFQISTDEGSYQLQAKDNKEALEWIRKLQDKRSEYNNTGSCREKQEEATKPMNIAVRTSGLMRLLEVSPESSPVGVRKIMQQILSPNTSLVSLPLSDVEVKTQALDELDGNCPIEDLPLSWSHYGDTDVCMDSRLPNQSKATLSSSELRLEYYKSQETSTSYYKEVQKFKQRLMSKELKIHALNLEIAHLKEKISALNIPVQVVQLQEEKASLQLTLKQLQDSIKLFAAEVDQHKEQAQMKEKRILVEKERTSELERSINCVKKKYIEVLTESLFKPVLLARDNSEISKNPRIVELLKEEGWETEGVFEDDYGDIHDWNTDANVQHFLCRCLYLHYTQHEMESLTAEWEKCLENLSKASSLSFDWSKIEFRDLLRKGLPITFRKEVWTILINRQVAKIKEVKDHTCGGVSYYQSLLNSVQQSTSRKQIDLDLHRTMPSNKFFRRGGSGIKQLENVLIAYSIHNKNVGYCQGINMIAALGLLFLDEEATFWYMVAIIEKLVPTGYYGPGLLGAQADQAVLQEVLASQLPDLNEHFTGFGIEIKLVSFNWFLTLFIDAMPTECALRIMDVFLNEGHKVMHRVAIGILKMYKDKFLSMHDPVGLFQLLKEITRHTYMIENVFNAAFVKEFPNRSHLNSRHSYHLNLFKHEWQQREKEVHKKVVVPVVKPPLQQSTKMIPLWECGCSIGSDEICLCCGERDQGVIAVISARQEPQMKIIPDMVIKGRAVCMKYISSCDMVLIGTLDFYVYAVDCLTWKELWSLRFIDSVLTMEAVENIVFFALAEGSVAVIKNIDRSYPLSEPLLIRIGSSSVPCLALVPNQMLWCGSEKSITVLSTVTCELEKSVVMNDGTGKIYKMKCGQQGVWVSFRSSTIICLFDVDRYTKLLQVDYVTLPTLETHERITYLLPVQGYLWLGTGDGTIHVLSVKARELPQQVEAHTTGQQTNSTAVASKSSVASSCGRVATEDKEEREGEEERRRLEEERHNSEDPTKLRDNRRERKTKFGAALHNRRLRPTENVGTLDAYELVLETSKHVVESRKEPVRTIQACQGPDNSTIVVSTVHTESDKAVQLWRCSDQNAANWDMVYLQCSEK